MFYIITYFEHKQLVSLRVRIFYLLSKHFLGMGEIFPVGPTSFSFIVPKDAPFHLYPQVGTVYPGQV